MQIPSTSAGLQTSPSTPLIHRSSNICPVSTPVLKHHPQSPSTYPQTSFSIPFHRSSNIIPQSPSTGPQTSSLYPLPSVLKHNSQSPSTCPLPLVLKHHPQSRSTYPHTSFSIPFQRSLHITLYTLPPVLKHHPSIPFQQSST